MGGWVVLRGNGIPRIHPLLKYCLDPSLGISYRNHQKSLVYFSHLVQLFFFLSKGLVKTGGGVMAQCTPPLNALLLPIYSCKVTLLNVRGKFVASDERPSISSLR